MGRHIAPPHVTPDQVEGLGLDADDNYEPCQPLGLGQQNQRSSPPFLAGPISCVFAPPIVLMRSPIAGCHGGCLDLLSPELAGQVAIVPVGQVAAEHIRPPVGQWDRAESHQGGESRP